MLQGVCSPFFAALSDALVAEGHQAGHVCFNAGDWLYRMPRPARHYRGKAEGLAEWLPAVFDEQALTDLVVFGDQRPVHRPAIALARERGIRVHVFEEGYFRPFWVTLERGGVNAHTALPKDPDWYRRTAARLPDRPAPTKFRSPFIKRAFHDVVYHMAGLANPVAYPGYRNHAPVIAPVEYTGYIGRFARLPFWRRHDAHRITELLESAQPYYVLPLQLNGDAQIREHSRFENMLAVISWVVRSFSHHAPGDTTLVIKNHPLDMGLTHYRRFIARTAAECGVAGRVMYLESGDLNALLQGAAGTVTVNSTVGAVSLEHGCPTLALADPIYNLPGMTWQGPLDAFWTEAERPDVELVRAFRKVVVHGTQINGGFYCRDGIALCVRNALPVLTADQSPLEQLF